MSSRESLTPQVLSLTDTMAEGVEALKQHIGHRAEGEVKILMRDLTDAFATVERVVDPWLVELTDQKIPPAADRLRDALSALAEVYEQREGQGALAVVQFQLEPAFKNWRREIERALAPPETIH